MDIARIPQNQTHLMVFGDNAFGYIPQVWAESYVLHIDSSGSPSIHDSRKHAKFAYTTGWSLFGSNTHTKVETCIGAGAVGRWTNTFEGSTEFEEKGLRTIIAMMAPLLKGVEEGKTKLFIKCDNRTALHRVRMQHQRYHQGRASRLTGVSQKAKMFFEWEKGHNGLKGNSLADKLAFNLRKAMKDYGTLSSMHSRDIVLGSVFAQDSKMAEFFNRFAPANQVLVEREGANAVAVVNGSSRKQKNRDWSWTCTQGFGSQFPVDDFPLGDEGRAEALERIANVARHMAVGNERIYLLGRTWETIKLSEKSYLRMFHDLDVVVLKYSHPWPDMDKVGKLDGLVEYVHQQESAALEMALAA